MFASDRKMILIEEKEIILAQSFLTYFLSQIKLGTSIEQAILNALNKLLERNISEITQNRKHLYVLKEIIHKITLSHYNSEDAFIKLSELFSVYTLKSLFSNMSSLTQFDDNALIAKIDTVLKILKIRLNLLKERELTIKTSQFRFIFISMITSFVLGLIVSLSPLLTLFYIETLFDIENGAIYLSNAYMFPTLFFVTVGLSYFYVLLKIFIRFFSRQKTITYILVNLTGYIISVVLSYSYLHLVLLP